MGVAGGELDAVTHLLDPSESVRRLSVERLCTSTDDEDAQKVLASRPEMCPQAILVLNKRLSARVLTAIAGRASTWEDNLTATFLLQHANLPQEAFDSVGFSEIEGRDLKDVKLESWRGHRLDLVSTLLKGWDGSEGEFLEACEELERDSGVRAG
jgi:hypothetical protein